MKRETTLHVVKPAAEEVPAPVTPATSKRWKDPKWKYVRHDATDLRKTFARFRREQAKAAKPKGKK